ncbi:hypothetical protein SCALM49S_08427 [Streptomyces californicus]
MNTYRRLLLPAVPRLAGSAPAGTAAGVLAGVLVGNVPLGLHVGIAAADTLFVVAGSAAYLVADGATVTGRTPGAAQELRLVAEEVVVVTAALLGLVGIVVLLLIGHTDLSHAAAALALCGVFMSWAALHLMYAARYAYLYYRTPGGGGIDFNTVNRRATSTSSTSATTWA